MSEVKRHLAGDIYDGAEVVYASDFDNSTRLFLDAAERAVASERREKELQQRLTAADDRNDEAIDLLRRARAVIAGGGWADLERDIAKFLNNKAALKPAETAAGHHPACRAVDDYKPGECSHGCKPAAQPQGEPVTILSGPDDSVCWTQDTTPKELRKQVVLIEHADFLRLQDLASGAAEALYQTRWCSLGQWEESKTVSREKYERSDGQLFERRIVYAEQPAPVAVVPDGYCIMPRQLTAENGAKALLLGEFKLLVTKECPECCELEEPTEGCSICDGEGEYGQKHTIPWDQIKYIYSKAVSGLAVKTESAKSQ